MMPRERRNSFSTSSFSAPLPPINAALYPSSSAYYASLQLAPMDRRRSFMAPAVAQPALTTGRSASPGLSAYSSSSSRAPSPSTSYHSPASSIRSQPTSSAFSSGSSYSTSPISFRDSYPPQQHLPTSSPAPQTLRYGYANSPIDRPTSGMGYSLYAADSSRTTYQHSAQTAATPRRGSFSSSTARRMSFSSVSYGAPPQHYNQPLPPPEARPSVTASKSRSTFSLSQITVLEDLLARALYPSSADIAQATQLTGMSEKQVKTWLSNRRAGRSGALRKSTQEVAQARLEPLNPGSYSNFRY